MTIELLPFRYRHERTGKWVQGFPRRDRCTLYRREITGAAEVRGDHTSWTGFHPCRVIAHAELARLEEPATGHAAGDRRVRAFPRDDFPAALRDLVREDPPR